MKTSIALFICYAFVFARTPLNIDDAAYDGVSGMRLPKEVLADRILIGYVGSVHSVLGSQGKSIAASRDGEVLVVFYGAPAGYPSGDMVVMIAYSNNHGVNWTHWGPFSGALSSMYNDIACTPDFHTNPGELWFVFQETPGPYSSVISVIIEENTGTVPCPSVPVVLPNSENMWLPSIAVSQDDPAHLVVTAWSFLPLGNEWAYCWISSTGGYSWTDTIPMGFISQDGAPGALAGGSDGFFFYAYLDYYTFGGTDSISYPHYMESTDGGYTWSEGIPITVFPANTSSQYWWCEFDCLVINDEPWVVYNDIGVGGTGGPHIAKATGSPGNWEWMLWDQGSIGIDSTWVGDTLYYCKPIQYPSISRTPEPGIMLGSSLYHIYIGDTLTWTTHNGPHVGGILTLDAGNSWTIAQPLSTANPGTITLADWCASETADYLSVSGDYSRNHTIWVSADGELYYESETIGTWPHGIEDMSVDPASSVGFLVAPSIVRSACAANLKLVCAGNVSLGLYDLTGRMVDNLFTGYLSRGSHVFDIAVRHFTNGIYFVVLKTESGQQVEKFVVVK